MNDCMETRQQYRFRTLCEEYTMGVESLLGYCQSCLRLHIMIIIQLRGLLRYSALNHSMSPQPVDQVQ